LFSVLDPEKFPFVHNSDYLIGLCLSLSVSVSLCLSLSLSLILAEVSRVAIHDTGIDSCFAQRARGTLVSTWSQKGIWRLGEEGAEIESLQPCHLVCLDAS